MMLSPANEPVPPGPEHRNIGPSLRTGVILVIVSILGIINWREPVLRLENHVANESVLLLLLLLPVGTIFALSKHTRGWRKAVSMLALSPLLVLNTILALPIGLLDLPTTASDASDLSFEPRQSLHIGSADVILYRTDCGAPCSWGLELREERVLIPHALKLVRTLGKWYPAEDGRMQRIGYRRISLVAASATHDGPQTPQEWTIAPWVYF